MINIVKIKNVRAKQELSHLKHIRKSKKQLGSRYNNGSVIRI